MACMNLSNVERGFEFGMSTNWNIKTANRAPRKEKLVPLPVNSTDFTPLIFPLLLNFYSVGYLLNKIRASPWLLWN